MLAPAGGHTFFINSADGKIRYEDFLMKEFMPQMEKKYRGEGTRATRGITGISMGGYGALRLAFKYPNEFAAVSAQMPALIAEVPESFYGGGPGSPAGVMVEAFGNPFNVDYFDRNNVFAFAKKDSVAELKQLKIYFDVGNNDDFGFEQRAPKNCISCWTRAACPTSFTSIPGATIRNSPCGTSAAWSSSSGRRSGSRRAALSLWLLALGFHSLALSH